MTRWLAYMFVTFAILVVIAVVLSGCGDRAEDRKLINSRLPEGCTFEYLGSYGNIDVSAVICDGRGTTTTSTYRRSGKVSHQETTVVIGP